ncbi:MAG: universal stress protein [Chthoniobacteraceae bacterium]
MNQLKRILLSTDFSPSSDAALAQAVRMARATNAHLEALHVVDVMAVREYAEAIESPLMLAEKEAGDRMQTQLVKWLARADFPESGRADVAIGIPLDVILRRAKELDASLLLLGLRGRSSPEGNAGTLALKCLRKSTTKVFLAHEGHSGPFRNVIACVDFSEGSREAVEQALRVARQDRCRVHFIHVFANLWHELEFHSDSPNTTPEPGHDRSAALLKRLRDFVGTIDGVEATFTIVEGSGVSLGIAEYALQAQADLLVLGDKGQSDLKYVLLGSTVERLLRKLPCSALVVRPPRATESAPAVKVE